MLKNNNLKSKRINPSILAIIILVLLLICAFVLFFEINDYRNIKEQQYNFYSYFASQKTNFKSKVSYNSNERVLSLETKNITLTSTPIYYTDYKEVILPSIMEIVYPFKSKPMYKLGNFSKLLYKGNYLYTNSEPGVGRLYDCFLYDGNDLYVFVENTSIVIGNDRYDLSPMSFIEVIPKGYIQIYDKEQDSYTYIKSYEGNVMAYTNEYSINLTEDTFTYNNLYYILIKNIEALDFYEF